MKKFILPVLAIWLAACSHSQPTLPLGDAGIAPSLQCPPLILAHRGASGVLPEHTLEAYALAIEMGADFIEPDLVSTKDGVLIARHENEISETTDVAQKFPKRQRRATIDGKSGEGWFAEDFTLAEIKTLRAKQRLASRSQKYNGKYAIPTFDEVLRLVQFESKRLKRPIGVYPETKHSSYHRSLGLPLEAKLLSALKKFGLDKSPERVFIQSFEVNNLKEIHQSAPQYRLIQLLDDPEAKPADQKELTYGKMVLPEGLASIASYAFGIGPHKNYVQPVQGQDLKTPTALVRAAHAAGLHVHIYTLRSDKPFLIDAYEGDPSREYRRFFQLGVDGLFSDFTDHAVKARAEYFADKSRCPN